MLCVCFTLRITNPIRTQVIRALKLPEEASVRDCALARNYFTRERITNDFYEGLQEMSMMAGDPLPSREELESRFKLPVFCVSSLDYQKVRGIRRADG